ncbi:MAG: serpin family protein, partial [Candidatus Thorarchaeota archaeon]
MKYDSRDTSEITRIATKRASSRTALRGTKVTADEIALAIGNSAFALGLYTRLSSQSEGNIFFSPYSISTALAMTYAGSTGRTESEMAEVLGFTMNQRRLHRVFHELGESLLTRSNAGDNELNIANAIWIQKGYSLLESFLYTISENYGNASFELDFQQTQAATERINGWVEEQTRDKIKDLIQPGVLTELTRLVLTNAIYFNGTWLEPFKEELTKPKPFYPTKGSQVEVPMMHRIDMFAFCDWPDVQILELPYSSDGQEGPDLSMVIFLPKEVDGLS